MGIVHRIIQNDNCAKHSDANKFRVSFHLVFQLHFGLKFQVLDKCHVCVKPNVLVAKILAFILEDFIPDQFMLGQSPSISVVPVITFAISQLEL